MMGKKKTMNMRRQNYFIYITKTRPQVERQYPLNLSILISGGKETNRDSLSSGERSGKSPSSESGRASSFVPRIVVSWQGIAEATALGKSPLEKGAREGDSPVHWSSVSAVSITRSCSCPRVGLFGNAALSGW